MDAEKLTVIFIVSMFVGSVTAAVVGRWLLHKALDYAIGRSLKW